MKEGIGKLYGSGDKPVYEGSFSQDQLVYSALLGKSTAEVAESYKGARSIYQSDSEFSVLMPDINALYVGVTDEENLDRYFAVSDQFDDVVYDFNVIDNSVMYWGGEYDYYEKAA